MKDIIMFDESNILWGSNEQNIMQMRRNMTYINCILRQRGYIYLNQIYECFEANWDTQRYNHCISYNGKEIRFEINIFDDKPELGYLIDIIW